MLGSVVRLLGLLLSVWSAAASHRRAQAESPLTRVIALLQGLADEAEKDGKKEEDLYESFVCWGKSVIEQKSASNSAAQARIGELETYIEDIDAGKIEFTTEDSDLTKELAAIKADIEAATALRQKEHAEFLSAEDELVKAIAALDQAVEVLAAATTQAKGGALFAQRRARARAGESLTARAQEADSLAIAATFGEKALSVGDALFLRRLLTGKVPHRRWKQLHREAPVMLTAGSSEPGAPAPAPAPAPASAYKARSAKISKQLKDMLSTFTQSLSVAQAKETEAQATFGQLIEAKTEQEAATTEALQQMEVEMGARGAAKEESRAEVDALTEQVAADQTFIAQTEKQLEEKSEEWKDRSKLRRAEEAAMAAATEMLTDPGARGYLTAAQRLSVERHEAEAEGVLLLQEEAHSAAAARRASRAGARRRPAARRAGGSARLASMASGLAARLATGSSSHFKEVLQAIDGMVTVIKAEESSDLEKKGLCEKHRAADTGAAILEARAVDESSDLITKLTAEITEITAEITSKQDLIAEVEKQRKEASVNRADEHAEWLLNVEDDHEALTAVQAAEDVLTKFYADNNLMLVQKASQSQSEPVVEAGQAPPPPPATWDAPYGGKTEGASGIIGMLGMIKEDIEKDAAEAKTAEQAAKTAFKVFDEESQTRIEALKGDITELTTTKGEKTEGVSEAGTARGNSRAELAATRATISDAEPGCDFVTANYGMRLENRQVEMDGLIKAKFILLGAKFEDAPVTFLALRGRRGGET
jgi:hypothetical protein